jgi:LCP family protein required for cell wall assembly
MTRRTEARYGVGADHAEEHVKSRSLYFDDTLQRRRRHWGRRLLIVLLAPILLPAGFFCYVEFRLHRVGVFGDDAGRPADTPGSNWLIVGSDSRDGLSKEQRKTYHTGGGVGKRTDSMMLLHIGDHATTLVSLPRDSYVPIPGHGSNKLNAAFAFGGPKLLARTIENSSGLHIDHYAEIGFGGFVGMVDAVGGVRMCIKAPVRDKKAGLNLKAGCQQLNGAQALGYVRSRHAFAGGDLDRVKHQREFLAALVHKATSPGVLANPFRSVPFAQQASESITVADGDHLWNLASFASAMRSVTKGDGLTTTVPVKGTGSAPGVGQYVTWDTSRAAALFKALREDQPVPKSG